MTWPVVYYPSHDVLCQASRGGRQMTSRIRLEPEVQAFADAAAKTPFLFTLGPQKGRIVLDEAQAGQVSTVPVDIDYFTIPDGSSGLLPLRILRPHHAQAPLPVVGYFHGPGWVVRRKKQ